MRKSKQIIYLFICLFILVSWDKFSNNPSSINEKDKTPNVQSNDLILARTDSAYSWTNENLLGLVLSGNGGFILVDSSCESCPYDTLSRGRISFLYSSCK